MKKSSQEVYRNSTEEWSTTRWLKDLYKSYWKTVNYSAWTLSFIFLQKGQISKHDKEKKIASHIIPYKHLAGKKTFLTKLITYHFICYCIGCEPSRKKGPTNTKRQPHNRAHQGDIVQWVVFRYWFGPVDYVGWVIRVPNYYTKKGRIIVTIADKLLPLKCLWNCYLFCHSTAYRNRLLTEKGKQTL